MGTIVLYNPGTRGAVDVSIPGTEREREMVVTTMKKTEKGRGNEVVKRIVRVPTRRSRILARGEQIVVDGSALDDPVIQSQLRGGVLKFRFDRERPPKKAKPTEEPAPKREKPAPAKADKPSDERASTAGPDKKKEGK